MILDFRGIVDEFSLINTYFKAQALDDPLVLLGIGDDAACMQVPAGNHLVVSMDTLVSGVHFPPDGDPYDIAWRAVMVNISDLAAMAAEPKWALLALTLPDADPHWLHRFSHGLSEAFKTYGVMLVGGDTTKGSLTVTLTMQGLVPAHGMVKRAGAMPGDVIFVSDRLGAAALAYTTFFSENNGKQLLWSPAEQLAMLRHFYYPVPRVDFAEILRQYASSAIDISDGLSADLNHICTASHVGATLDADAIPIHPLLKRLELNDALQLALSGGDDYELCFTVPSVQVPEFKQAVQKNQLACYEIGVIESTLGLRQRWFDGRVWPLASKGYQHF